VAGMTHKTYEIWSRRVAGHACSEYGVTAFWAQCRSL
jgi:hypothetical protein